MQNNNGYFAGDKYTDLITLFEIDLEEGEAISILSMDQNVVLDNIH